jgi:hypothetical protein
VLVPDPDQILAGLANVTNDWRALAIGWHGYFAVLLVALAIGLRPSARIVGLLLTLPLLSVGALAWMTGNPFNGSLFTVVGATLIARSVTLRRRIVIASSPVVACGVAVLLFGWSYPHFLVTESVFEYLYAAPVGLIPCPTLAVVTGFVLLADGLGSRAWTAILGVIGLFYGVFGALVLGVSIDWILTIAALAMLVIGLGGLARNDPVDNS